MRGGSGEREGRPQARREARSAGLGMERNEGEVPFSTTPSCRPRTEVLAGEIARMLLDVNPFDQYVATRLPDSCRWHNPTICATKSSSFIASYFLLTSYSRRFSDPASSRAA